ncbi:hypothetical protein ACGYLX_10250 [Sulfitobacter sp. 1A13496]|uniref:hypothetical protein n=1 Tax=Sulfitobacter sp. 1A13496 TaxID=3368596 RepID=UPI003745CC39
MPVHEDLISEIENSIASASGLNYNHPTATNDVYENYVWALCVEAAREKHASISYETVSGVTPSILTFRTSPGNIYSTAQDYTHAILEFENCPQLEVHVGIRVIGKSRVLHECDVAILYRDEAQFCRSENVHPRAARVLIAAECKFYTSALQLHLGRGFLGLTRDIHAKERYFVTNSQSASVAKLIRHHQAEWDFGVIPSATEASELKTRFGRAFRNFVIDHS